MLWLAFKVARVALLVVVAYLLFTFAQVWWASTRDDRTPTQAIVVLGAAQYDGDPSPVFAARLDHAYQLWDSGVADTIVVTGGSQDGDRFTEASAAAVYLHGLGVPDEAILRETTGRSSWESLAASARFLSDRGIEEVTLVSDPFHAKRIDAIASEVGLDGHVSPTPDSPISGGQHWRRLGSETLRVAAGRIVGFRRLMQAQRVGELVPGLAMLLPVTACERRHRSEARAGVARGFPIGGGVIGNTAGSGPVIEGSSPSPRARVGP